MCDLQMYNTYTYNNQSTDYVMRVHLLLLLPVHSSVEQHFMWHHKKAMLMLFVY